MNSLLSHRRKLRKDLNSTRHALIINNKEFVSKIDNNILEAIKCLQITYIALNKELLNLCPSTDKKLIDRIRNLK